MAAACRYQQESRAVLEELGSSLLQGEQSGWAGSPRGPPRRAQAPFASSQSGSEDEDEQDLGEAEVAKQHKQAELVVQPLQQLERVIVAAESLSRQAYPHHSCSSPTYTCWLAHQVAASRLDGTHLCIFLGSSFWNL